MLKKKELINVDVISDENIKSQILSKSVFAVAKSGTVSLEICKSKVPSTIIYKMNFLNYLIVKSLVKIKYANIINFAAKEEIIPELLQSNCNPKNIFNKVSNYLDNPKNMDEQISKTQLILKNFKTNTSSSILAAKSINKYL